MKLHNYYPVPSHLVYICMGYFAVKEKFEIPSQIVCLCFIPGEVGVFWAISILTHIHVLLPALTQHPLLSCTPFNF